MSHDVEGPAAIVVGGGTMGAGIAQCLVRAGITVVVTEAGPEKAQAARARITDGLARLLGRTPGPAATAGPLLDRLEVRAALPTHIEPDLVIEAVPEDADLKASVLARLDAAYPAAEVVASNTSSLSIDRLAEAVSHPARFLGMHFFNPVPQSELVELVIGAETAPATLASARRWVERLGKESIEVRDSPGFATSRLGLAIGLEAMRMVEEGVASAHDIDRGMTLGYRFPIGPLRLTDLVGLDVRLAIAEHLARELGPRFEPPALLRNKVAAGQLGKKTGKGFYTW